MVLHSTVRVRFGPGELGDTQSALNIHAPETLLGKTSDCWSSLGNGLDCTRQKQDLEQDSSPSPEGVGVSSAAISIESDCVILFASMLLIFFGSFISH